MATKYVFIDANAFLNVYVYKEDLTPQLKDLIKYIKKKEIKLILTQQLIDEIYRNREERLGNELKEVKKWVNLVSNLNSYWDKIALVKTVKDSANEIYKKLIGDIEKENLESDILFKEIQSLCEIMPLSPEIIQEAKERFELGNPPGKRRSYGDAINWITLIKKIPDKQNLYFIAVDKDFESNIASYLSELDKNKFSLFLRKEWKTKKNSEIIFYKSIAGFIKEVFPEAGITPQQVKKEESIQPETPKLIEIERPTFLPYNNNYNYPVGDLGSYFSHLPWGYNTLMPNNTDSGIPKNKKVEVVICRNCNKIISPVPDPVLYGLPITCPHCGYNIYL